MANTFPTKVTVQQLIDRVRELSQISLAVLPAVIGNTDPLILNSNFPVVGFNGYWNGVINKYFSNGFAAQIYRDGAGNLLLQTAPSGNANGTITYSTALTIFNDRTVRTAFNFNCDANITANGHIACGVGSVFFWPGKSYIYSSLDGLLTFFNNGTTSGIGFNFNTDGTVTIRNRGQTNDAQLAAASVRGNAVTFANIPVAPVEGMLVAITDSTTVVWGATITGGGGNHVLAYYNGTNWTVVGK